MANTPSASRHRHALFDTFGRWALLHSTRRMRSTPPVDTLGVERLLAVDRSARTPEEHDSI